MNRAKRARAWALAAIVASSLVLGPSRARASETSDAAPFMIMAAAFTVTIIIIAINNPTNDQSKTATTDTTKASQSLRYSPMAGGPSRSTPILGLSGHF